MKERTVCKTQRVRVTLEITMRESWDGTVTLDQITRDAERVACDRVRHLLQGQKDVALVSITAPSCAVTYEDKAGSNVREG